VCWGEAANTYRLCLQIVTVCPCAWQEVDIEVYRHLGSLTATPLDMVFSWLGSAFASHLVPAETLLLWDRIIGFDSLLPLPVLAVAVLTFRCVPPTSLSAMNNWVPCMHVCWRMWQLMLAVTHTHARENRQNHQ
jgi:hypothetical protein